MAKPPKAQVLLKVKAVLADPSDGGGYSKTIEEGTPHPLFLPDDVNAVKCGTR